MAEHDLEKLLGGFAPDILTPEERRLLFAAALRDQQLFDALADEQALKELLADPVVRRRLLEAVRQPVAPPAGRPSWREWFFRPAGLAFAGGLAAAVFAVAVGTRILEDSLQTVSPPPSTETTDRRKPVPLQPESSGQERMKSSSPTQTDQPPRPSPREKRKQPAPPAPGTSPDDDGKRFRETGRSEQEQERTLAKGADTSAAPTEQRNDALLNMTPAAESMSPAVASKQELRKTAPAEPAAPSSPAMIPSARALFYGTPPSRQEPRATRPFSQPAPDAAITEPKSDNLSRSNKTLEATRSAKALGLRYSFLTKGPDGQDAEVDAVSSAKSSGQRITIEVNQDAYIQVWQLKGTSLPQLLFPDKETGRISLRMQGGHRQTIRLPDAYGAITIRLSLTPFGPMSRQEAVMLARPSTDQIQETSTSTGADGAIDHAVYVVTLDQSPNAQIAVEISQPPE
ncbi:hypothetical protein W02_34350 [Nitrospira sp. KM1]|uniref:hypothetical protein n=1 Tax=Nitrospira sp. KM1 TaxID=1936990 RepID=UPI0013A777C7|nr:hypothetical protein [Nitrospira sp. KM1]BCA56295.1 hypothetical protein W02_34350 [Nitrospira sp. KM1]